MYTELENLLVKVFVSTWSHQDFVKYLIVASFPGSPRVQTNCKRWKAGLGLGTRLTLLVDLKSWSLSLQLVWKTKR